MLVSTSLMPTLLFADPWGYKGLTMNLFSDVLKQWGCEVIFFFNYSRINAAMTHKGVKRHINSLFGEKRAERIREEFVRFGKDPDEPAWFEKASPEERESIILSQVAAAFNEALAPKPVYTLTSSHQTGRL
jgi:three-Cys-motif partner protein